MAFCGQLFDRRVYRSYARVDVQLPWCERCAGLGVYPFVRFVSWRDGCYSTSLPGFRYR